MTPEAHAILDALEFRMPMLLRNVEPLSEDQLRWLPGPAPSDRKPIAWQLWHIAEVEDNWPRMGMLGEPPRFPLGKALAEAGDDYPDKSTLLGYLAEVRTITGERLASVKTGDLDRIIHDPDFGDLTVRQLWAGVTTSFAWHAGQVALTAKLIPDSPVTTWTFTGWDDKKRS
jgi:DinB superfamily